MTPSTSKPSFSHLMCPIRASDFHTWQNPRRRSCDLLTSRVWDFFKWSIYLTTCFVCLCLWPYWLSRTSCVVYWEVKDETSVSTSHAYLCFSTRYPRGQPACLEDFAFVNTLSLSSPHLHSLRVSRPPSQLSSRSSLRLLLLLLRLGFLFNFRFF